MIINDNILNKLIKEAIGGKVLKPMKKGGFKLVAPDEDPDVEPKNSIYELVDEKEIESLKKHLQEVLDSISQEKKQKFLVQRRESSLMGGSSIGDIDANDYVRDQIVRLLSSHEVNLEETSVAASIQGAPAAQGGPWPKEMANSGHELPSKREAQKIRKRLRT